MTLKDKTPVTIITGFLGAGKTTLGETRLYPADLPTTHVFKPRSRRSPY